MTGTRAAEVAFSWAVHGSAAGGAIIVLLLAAHWGLRRRVAPRVWYWLWVLAAVRLALPPLAAVTVRVPHWSAFAHARSAAAAPPTPSDHARCPASPDPTNAITSGHNEGTTSSAEADAGVRVASPAPLATEQFEVAAAPARAEIPDAAALAAVAASRTPAVPEPKSSPAQPGVLSSTRHPINWRHVLAFTWLAGAGAMLAGVAVSSWRLSRAVRRLPRVDDPTVLELIDDCCRTLRLRRAPMVLCGPPDAGPALVGVLRPRLLLPPCVLADFGWRELRLILLHELIHLRRRDVLVGYAVSFVQAIHWFNPLVWLAFGRLRAERELACDEAVLRITPWRESRAYGSTIVKLIEIMSRGGAHPLSMGVLQHESLMHRRIAMIARFDGTRPGWSASGTLMSLLIGGACVVGVVRAEAPDGGGAPAAEPAVANDAAQAGEEGVDQARIALDQAAGEQRPEANETPDAPAPVDAGPTVPDAAGPTPQPPGGPGIGSPFQPAAAPPPGADNAPPSPAPPPPGADNAPPSPAPRPGVPATPPPINSGGIDMPPGPGPATPPPDGGRGFVPGPQDPRPGVMPGGGPRRNVGTRFARPGMNFDGGRSDASDIEGGGLPPIVTVEDASSIKADAQALERLQKLHPLSADSVPLRDLLNQLADVSGVDILIDNKGFEDAGRTSDVPVTMMIRQPQPVGQLLRMALRVAAGDDLDFSLVHGVVLVSSRAELARHLVTRVYEIGNVDGDHDAVLGALETVVPGAVRPFGQKVIITASEPKQREAAKLLGMLEARPPAAATDQRPGARAGDNAPMSRDFLDQYRALSERQVDINQKYGERHPLALQLARSRAQSRNEAQRFMDRLKEKGKGDDAARLAEQMDEIDAVVGLKGRDTSPPSPELRQPEAGR